MFKKGLVEEFEGSVRLRLSDIIDLSTVIDYYYTILLLLLHYHSTLFNREERTEINTETQKLLDYLKGC